MPAAINIKEFRNITRIGVYRKPPGKYNRKVPILNHDIFLKGWTQTGKDRRVFKNLRFVKAKTNASIGKTYSATGSILNYSITVEELIHLESIGMQFHACDIYKQLKCSSTFMELGT